MADDDTQSLPAELPAEIFAPQQPITPGYASKAYDILTGGNGQERYQLFPERIVRSALSLPTDVMSGKVQTAVSGGNQPLSSDTGPEDELLQRVQDMAALMGGGGVAGVAKAGGNVAKDTLGVVPVGAAKRMNVTPSAPSDVLKAAVENTPGAAIDPDGALRLTVSRRQQPDQAGEESVRGGVFYLPKGMKSYSYTGKNGYGGSQAIEGETAYLNPLVVKGATGGKAPERAYDQLQGKGAYEAMRKEASVAQGLGAARGNKEPEIEQFLQKYAPEMADQAYNIIRNSTYGNQLSYALQEAAVASAARKAGHDGIIGYSNKRDGSPFLSEIFDVRESHYPTTDGDYTVHSHYLRSDNEAAAPIAALENAPTFHSAVENAVNTSTLKSANPDQWLGTIKNAKGVKPEELDWTGLKDWLGEQSGPVSKEEVQGYLNQNKVGLGEVNKADKPPIPADLAHVDSFRPVVKNIETPEDVALARKHNPNFKETFKNQTDQQVFDDIQKYKQIPYPEADPTKYSKYQLPGGESYREKLLTLPPKEINVKDFYNNTKAKDDPDWNKLPRNEKEHWAQIAFDENPNYKSSHWDEPNILAHIRMNDRTIEGKNALHIEEVQSDWAQGIRQHGFKLNDAQKAELESIDNKLTSGLSEGDIGNPDMNSVLKTAIDKKVITQQEANKYRDYSKGDNSQIPDMPFKKTWLDLALKRVIREAAEGGKSRISWTPGEAQAARYDLSKQVDTIQAYRKADGTYDLHARPVNDAGFTEVGISVPKNKLADHVGKDLAEKIANQDKPVTSYKGLDLKVGGEGMHYFYDKMLPAALEKLTGQKMKVGSFQGTGNDWKKHKINYIDLPQSVKDTALHKGFPLFSSGLMLSPLQENENPFARSKYKLVPVTKGKEPKFK